MVTIRREPQREVIGLIPAAGQATRLGLLPCSKEIFPLGFRLDDVGNVRPKAICHYLLESMRLAGVQKAYVALRTGKWDIPGYLGDGALVDMQLGYLIVRLLYGVPYTLDQAYPFVRDAVVALGYPDILFRPRDSYSRLLDRQCRTGADLVLGAVPFENPQKGGMISFDSSGRIRSIIEKPTVSDAKHSYCTVVWTPAFTEFLHAYLMEIEQSRNVEAPPGAPTSMAEVILADVMQAAIAQGLRAEAVVFPDGGYLDIGTPKDFVTALRNTVLQEDPTHWLTGKSARDN